MMFRFTSKLYQFNLSGRDKLVLELMTFKNIRKHDLLKYRTYWYEAATKVSCNGDLKKAKR